MLAEHKEVILYKVSMQRILNAKRSVVVSFITVSILALVVAPALVSVYAQVDESITPTPEVSVEPEVYVEPTSSILDDGVTDVSTPDVFGATTESSNVSEKTNYTPLVSPVLTTDKDVYHPEDTMSIFGSFFASLQNIVLKILLSFTEIN